MLLITEIVASDRMECIRRIQPLLSSRPLTIRLKKVTPDSHFVIKCPEYGELVCGSSVSLPLEVSRLDKVRRQLEGLPPEFTEIFHREYAELDSGNMIDKTGAVSSLLDELADGVRAVASSKFDKVSMRNRDEFTLVDLHFDHFNSVRQDFRRSTTRAFRYIFNLGKTTRYTAVMPLPIERFGSIPDLADNPYPLDYVLPQNESPLDIYLLPILPRGEGDYTISYMKIDVFNVVHGAYGSRGDFSAMITSTK